MEEDHRQEQINMQKLDEQLMHVMPLVKEANLIAVELKRPQRVELKMHVELNAGRSRNAVRVAAGVWKDGVELYEWTPETLENRVFLMRELLERCDEEGQEVANSLHNEEDPWWDPVKVERLIGVAQVILEPLTEQLENAIDARILSNEGRQCGKLHVEIWPVSKDGKPGIPDEEVLENLIGSRMVILLRVVRATDLPADLATDVRIEYTYFIEDRPQQVPAVQGFNCNPQFDYENTFVQDPVTTRFLQYLTTQNIAFYVYGRNVAVQQMYSQSLSPPAPLPLTGLGHVMVAPVANPGAPRPALPLSPRAVANPDTNPLANSTPAVTAAPMADSAAAVSDAAPAISTPAVPDGAVPAGAVPAGVANVQAPDLVEPPQQKKTSRMCAVL